MHVIVIACHHTTAIGCWPFLLPVFLVAAWLSSDKGLTSSASVSVFCTVSLFETPRPAQLPLEADQNWFMKSKGRSGWGYATPTDKDLTSSKFLQGIVKRSNARVKTWHQIWLVMLGLCHWYRYWAFVTFLSRLLEQKAISTHLLTSREFLHFLMYPQLITHPLRLLRPGCSVNHPCFIATSLGWVCAVKPRPRVRAMSATSWETGRVSCRLTSDGVAHFRPSPVRSAEEERVLSLGHSINYMRYFVAVH